MRLCLIGGTPSHPGGLEAFCDRAVAALVDAAPSAEVFALPTNTAYRGLRALLDLPFAAWRLRRLVRQYDVAWVQVSNLPDAFHVLLAHWAGMRVLATPHFGANSALQRKAVRRRLMYWLMGRADHLLLLFAGQDSEIALPAVESTVLGTFLPKSSLGHAGNSVIAAEDRPPLFRLVHAARFSAAKGTFHMLALCTRLHAAGVSFDARLIGRSDFRTMAAITEAIDQGGLGAVVRHIEWLDEASMQRQLREADVLVHLSSIDSFPLVVLEALAADCLPVVLPMAGAGAMVSALGGVLADPTDPVGSAFKQLTTLGPDRVRNLAAAAGVKTRHCYGWPVMAERVLSACRNVPETHP